MRYAVARWLVLASLLLVSPARAGTFYVSLDGDDGNAGDRSAPFRTLVRASNAAKPGDDVLVFPGTYHGAEVIQGGGRDGARVSYRPEQPGSVIFDGAETEKNTDLIQITGSHIEFRGFRVENARRSGISLWGTSDVIVAGNQVLGSVRAGIWVGHQVPYQSSWNTISDNVVYGNCLENTFRIWRSGWPRAIAVDLSDNTSVQRNIVFQNYGEGIGLLSTSGASISDNVVFDNFSVNIYLDNAPRSTVEGNLVFNTGDRRYFRRNNPAHGIVIANEQTPFPMPSKGIRVVNNELVGMGNVHYSHYGAGGGLSDSVTAPNQIALTADFRTLQRRASEITGRALHLPLTCDPFDTPNAQCQADSN